MPARPDPLADDAPAGSEPLGAAASVWEAHARPPSFAPLDRDLDADVVVVGGGITGLSAAAFLRHAGANVAVVEARRIGGGTTGRSTGHLTELIDTDYHVVEKDFGEEGAVLARTAARGAIEDVRRLAEQYAPEARYRRVDAYYYPASADDEDLISKEVEAAQRARVHATLVDDVPLPFPVRHALHAPDQAGFDPLAYVHGLARGLSAEGLSIYEGTRVQQIEAGGPVRLETENGRTITARRVILGTHTPIGFNPLQTELPPYRSYVLGFHLPDGRYPEGLFFDTDPQAYRYLRTAAFGGERVLVVGGGDHKVGAKAGADDGPYREVMDYVLARFPGAVARYHWSDEVFEPVDGLPLIGVSPHQENVFVGTGYAGDGLLWGTAAGRILADLVRDVESPYAELFKTTRIKPLAGGPSFLKENVEVAVRWVTDRAAFDVETPDELAPGQGGLLFHDGEHLAVYRDEAGALHACSPVCPHLKCVVRWNGADRTWDCPCHGSRFEAATGAVIAGPTMHPLEPRALGGA
jgi:glycine/D-amino acid oxidase-like deaminating enzyme/nitrite reductase/ring-hydroxylating ferredoxin subunit